MSRISLQKESGSALILSLILLGVISLSAIAVQISSHYVNKSIRDMRVRSLMSSAEERLVQFLLSPTSYNCNSAVGFSSCTFTDKTKTELGRILPISGSNCLNNNTSCGILIKDLTFNPTTHEASAKISYQGLEVSIRERVFSLKVPAEILQSNQFQCPTNSPVFEGFDLNGRAKCRGFQRASAGQYIKDINRSNISPIFASLPSSVSCANTQFIDHLDWKGGSSINFKCKNRLDVTHD